MHCSFSSHLNAFFSQVDVDYRAFGPDFQASGLNSLSQGLLQPFAALTNLGTVLDYDPISGRVEWLEDHTSSFDPSFLGRIAEVAAAALGVLTGLLLRGAVLLLDSSARAAHQAAAEGFERADIYPERYDPATIGPIGRGIVNPRSICYLNAAVKALFLSLSKREGDSPIAEELGLIHAALDPIEDESEEDGRPYPNTRNTLRRVLNWLGDTHRPEPLPARAMTNLLGAMYRETNWPTRNVRTMEDGGEALLNLIGSVLAPMGNCTYSRTMVQPEGRSVTARSDREATDPLIPVITGAGAHTTQGMLRNWCLNSDFVEGYRPEENGPTVTARDLRAFNQTPPLLFLQLPRFGYEINALGEAQYVRHSAEMEPSSTLYIPVFSPENGRCTGITKFRRASTICHYGDRHLHGGHYTVIEDRQVEGRPTDLPILHNDANVYPISGGRAERQRAHEAYVVGYEREEVIALDSMNDEIQDAGTIAMLQEWINKTEQGFSFQTAGADAP